MAELPRLISRQTLPSTAGGARRNPRSVGVAAEVAAFSREIQSLLVTHAEDEGRARRAAELNRAETEAARSLGALEFSFEGDPDFASYEGRFTEAAEAIKEDLAAGIIDSRVETAFKAKFDDLAVVKQFNLRNAARKKEIDHGVATLDGSVAVFAAQAAGAPSDVERNYLIASADVAIARAADAGFITRTNAGVRARELRAVVDEARARALITGAPDMAVEAIADDTVFPNLDPLRRRTLFDSALRQAEAARKDRVRQLEKAEREASRRQRAAAEDIAKDGWSMHAEDRLTARWLAANRDDLELSEYKALLKAAESDDAAADDPDALVDLNGRLDREDIAAAAAEYLRQGKLTTGTYITITGRNRSALKDDRPASPYRSARDRVRVSLDPGGLVSGPAAQIARIGQSSALAELDAFAEANPQASRLDYNNEAEAVIDRFQIINFDQMKLSLGLPRFFQGRRDDLAIADLDAAEARAVAAFDAGAMTRDGIELELRKLRNWRAILARKPAPRPRAGGAPNPARPE